MNKRSSLRELGISIGNLPTGPQNAITDVGEVRVGHATLISGAGALRPGHGPVRTGVTVILPHEGNLFQEKVYATVHTINGFGKVAGFEQVRELGVLESPIALTNTLNVGLVQDALVQHAIQQSPEIGRHSGSVNVVVGETNDGYLNDLQGRHVRAGHVLAAIESASGGPVDEGAIGAGTGTCCLGWKGGIGSASRILPEDLGGFSLGILVQSNFGQAQDLAVNGIPLGKMLPRPVPSPAPAKDGGSIMIVLATDAPLSSRQLKRVCARAAAGLVRVGSYLAHGSGDFVVAFSTARRIPHQPTRLVELQPVLVDEERLLAVMFRATIEGVEEAVLNSLCQAETMIGRDDHVAYGLPVEQVVELIQKFGHPSAAKKP